MDYSKAQRAMILRLDNSEWRTEDLVCIFPLGRGEDGGWDGASKSLLYMTLETLLM